LPAAGELMTGMSASAAMMAGTIVFPHVLLSIEASLAETDCVSMDSKPYAEDEAIRPSAFQRLRVSLERCAVIDRPERKKTAEARAKLIKQYMSVGAVWK
jgi:hypothetical protein